jgi:ADP-ribosylglycohydrolase
MLGEDTDTIGAVAGAVAGVRCWRRYRFGG